MLMHTCYLQKEDYKFEPSLHNLVRSCHKITNLKMSEYVAPCKGLGLIPSCQILKAVGREREIRGGEVWLVEGPSVQGLAKGMNLACPGTEQGGCVGEERRVHARGQVPAPVSHSEESGLSS